MWKLIALALWPGLAMAESVVTTHNLPARTIVGPGDVTLTEEDVSGALTDIASAIGLETRVAIYAGRPVRADDLVPAAAVERNARVILLYGDGGLAIRTEGRALDRAAPGEIARAMNLDSRTTVSGVVAANGTILVGGGRR